MVFDNLVFHHTHAGLRHRHLGKRDPLPVGCHGRGVEDVVHLFLSIGGERPLCLTHLPQLFIQRVQIVHQGDGLLILFLHDRVPPIF